MTSANGRERDRTVWGSENKMAAHAPSNIRWVQHRYLEVKGCVIFLCMSRYHGELGLEFNLQVLHQALQVGDLALAGLKLLRVAADLFSELSALQQYSGWMV